MKAWFISLICAVILSVFAAAGAVAQGPVTITVTQIDQSRFPQIDVFVSATDASGAPVRNLAPDAFRLEQNGKPVALTAATRSGEQGPVSTVLVIDHSGSMSFSGKMAGAKQAATTFVNMMRLGDKTALVQFDTETETLQPLTDDKSALSEAIQKITPRGNTAMYDALAQAGKYFESTSGRKAMIVVTDGMDNASKTKRDDILQRVTTGGYSLYTIGLGNKGAGYGSQEGIDEVILRELAQTSLGAYYYTPDAGQLAGLYQQLSFLIQNEYKLTYTSPDALRDGLARSIVVTAPGTATRATYNPGGLIPEAAPEWSSWAFFLLALGLLVALFFAPLLLRRFTERQGPSAPPSRIKLTGATVPAAAQGPSNTSANMRARPTRIKIGKRSPAGHDRTQLPWEE